MEIKWKILDSLSLNFPNPFPRTAEIKIINHFQLEIDTSIKILISCQNGHERKKNVPSGGLVGGTRWKVYGK